MDPLGQINELQNKLELLLKKQATFSLEVTNLQKEIALLRAEVAQKPLEDKKTEPTILKEKQPVPPHITTTGFYRDINHRILGGVCSGLSNYMGIHRIILRILWVLFSLFFGVGFLVYIILWLAIPKIKKDPVYQKPIVQTLKTDPAKPSYHPKPETKPIRVSNELEKFIGENLINKIGIAILIIGVSIGAKYTIDNNLINPVTRIILGYLMGLGLIGFGLKLKAKYEKFSAVLVSGAMAIMYFITYAAYGYYALIPQELAFFLMFAFTAFTVFAALKYNNQLIANIGLVGAYAVPFILGDDTANVVVLFSYMSIINCGILILSFKKYWKSLYYASFILTSIIYLSWYLFDYHKNEHFALALIFQSIFFIQFYITFLAYKLIKKEAFSFLDILFLLANSFIFYGLGYSVLDNHETGQQLLGLFTICNGILHFIVSIIIYKLKLADKNLFYLVSGLVLVFITIAIPVQLDGNWVTLLWIGEALLLFWIGRTKSIAIYESLSYPLMVLAVFSLYQDWGTSYLFDFSNSSDNKITPVFNIQFLSTILFIGAFSFIYILNNNNKYISAIKPKNDLLKTVSLLMPGILLTTIYFGVYMEIANYFQLLYNDSLVRFNDYQNYFNQDILKFKTVFLILYSLLFLSVLSFVNIKKLKNQNLGHINLILNGFALFIFLTVGLYTLSELRDNYLTQNFSDYYETGINNILLRYLSFAFVTLILYASYNYLKASFINISFSKLFSVIFSITLLWILSSEIINLMDLGGSTQSHKLGLSIFWGVYSLALIIWGIWKKQKHLRLAAIVLFSVTLIKLFFYDIAHLGTLSKTIVFVSLGILLLIISFLYNKFKHQIADDNEA